MLKTMIWAVLRTKESWNKGECIFRRKEWLLKRDGHPVISNSLWEIYYELNNTDLVWLARYKDRKVSMIGDKIIVTCPAAKNSPIILRQVIELKLVSVEELANELTYKVPIRS